MLTTGSFGNIFDCFPRLSLTQTIRSCEVLTPEVVHVHRQISSKGKEKLSHDSALHPDVTIILPLCLCSFQCTRIIVVSTSTEPLNMSVTDILLSNVLGYEHFSVGIKALL